MGHEVVCFAPYVDKDGCFPDYPEMQEIKNLLPPPPIRLPFRHTICVLACCVLAPIVAPRFARFDVLFAANQPAPWIAYVLSKLLRKPYVIYLAQPFRLLHPRNIDLSHGLRIRDGDQSFVKFVCQIGRPFIDWADRMSVGSSSAVLTNGSNASRWIADIYGCLTINCPAGCHPTDTVSSSNSSRWKGCSLLGKSSIAKRFLLVTNRHAPHKRFVYALWALKRIRKEWPGVSLVISGQETAYTDQLKYLAGSLGLETSVHFVGLANEVDLRILCEEGAVYLYPVPEEDFGMGIVEAMSAGTPVVAWNNAGPTVIVQHGKTGYLVEPFDTDEFAGRILTLLRNRELNRALGESAHAVAKRSFSYDRHNRLILEVLASVARNGFRNLQKLPQFSDGELVLHFEPSQAEVESNPPRC